MCKRILVTPTYNNNLSNTEKNFSRPVQKRWRKEEEEKKGNYKTFYANAIVCSTRQEAGFYDCNIGLIQVDMWMSDGFFVAKIKSTSASSSSHVKTKTELQTMLFLIINFLLKEISRKVYAYSKFSKPCKVVIWNFFDPKYISISFLRVCTWNWERCHTEKKVKIISNKHNQKLNSILENQKIYRGFL